MITVEVPGKLFIAGEYAVVTPGEPAILVAVDRCVRVQATHVPSAPAGTGTLDTDLFDDTIAWRHVPGSGLTFSSHRDEHLKHALLTDTISVVDEMARARGRDPLPVSLEITSELVDAEGRKFGLGSSGAVAVGLVSALNLAWELQLTNRERFQLALLATLGTSPRASGGDVATSTVTGWVRYASPNRDWLASFRETHGVAATLAADWEGLELEQLPAPTGLTLAVGWTGSPANTDTLVAQTRPDPMTLEAFLTTSRAAVDELTVGLRRADSQQVLAGLMASRDALALFDVETGGSIETPELKRLSRIAESHGAVAKPSGAGGGDCGIAVCDRHAKLSRIIEDWRDEGILPLDLEVYTREDAS